MISKLRKTPRGKKRLIFAYVDIGEAEDYRFYWKNNWYTPTGDKLGFPDYILGSNEDGWQGN